MKIKLLDTQTGLTQWTDYPFSIWWWAEGNGACDCNRALEFGHEGHCGEKPYRYQAVDVCDHKDKNIQEQLNEFNQDLLEKYHLKTRGDIVTVINGGFY